MILSNRDEPRAIVAGAVDDANLITQRGRFWANERILRIAVEVATKKMRTRRPSKLARARIVKAISGFIPIKLSGLRPDTLRSVLKRPQRTCDNLGSMSGFTGLRYIYEPGVVLSTFRHAAFPKLLHRIKYSFPFIQVGAL